MIRIMLRVPAFVLLAAQAAGLMAAPIVTALAPRTFAPGVKSTVELRGQELSEGLRAVAVGLAAPLHIGPIQIEAVEATKAVGSIEMPAEYVGPIGVWPVTAAGPAPAALAAIVDDLPASADSGGNTSREAAQELMLPACLDGTISERQADHYRFKAAAGQRIAVEVLTRQIGSSMDPVVRLLDASGRVLVTSDDSAGGAECRFSHVFAAAGDYLLELRHSAHVNAAAYHLRVGDFPIVSHAMPLAVQRGTRSRVAFGGLDGAAVPPPELSVTADGGERGLVISGRLPGGRASAWAQVLVEDAPQVVEPSVRGPLAIPVGISGRLEKPGEHDAYRIAGTKDVRVRIASRARSLGCGTVPRMRLLDAAGKLVAETTVSEADEPEFVATFPADGEYTLQIDDLARRGGPDFGYHVAVDAAPGVAIAVKPDKKTRDVFAVEPTQGCAAIDVAVTRAGYDGAVELSLSGPAAGLRIVNPVIPEEAKEARIYLATDPAWGERSLSLVRLVARAGASVSRVPVTTTALRRAKEPFVAFPRPEADGLVFIAGVKGGPARFELAPPSPVTLSRAAATHEILLAVKRLDPNFTGSVVIGGQLVPTGFSVASTFEKDLCRIALSGRAVPGSEPTSLRLLAVSEIGIRQAIAEIDLPVKWADASAAPPAEAVARAQAASSSAANTMPTKPADPAVAPPPFSTDYPAAIAKLKPRVAASLAQTTEAFQPKGDLQMGPTGFATFGGGRLDGVGPPLGEAWSVSLWFLNLLIDDERPVTAYLFSRAADGDSTGGDHFGIGGNFPNVKPGKLFLFNGNMRGEVLLGTTRLAPRQWHHAVLVRSGDRVKVYLDGSAKPEIDAVLAPTGTGLCGFFCGARADNFSPLQGNMAHVALFDRALSAEEATSLYAAAVVASAAPPASKNGDQPAPPPAARVAEAASTSPPATTAAAVAPRPAETQPAKPQPGFLSVYPPAIVLDGGKDRQQIAVTSIDTAGFSRDWTGSAKLAISAAAVAEVRGTTVFPAGDGTTELVVEAAGLRQVVPVTVKNVAVVRPTQFENELMVALSKQTCSSGACHGSPSGKGGFRLSLRAFDKGLDELTLLHEEFGRRVNPLDPDASILLRKPLMKVPHGGGKQMTVDDEAHAVIRTWIAEGARPDPPNAPRCVRLEVSPVGSQVQRLEDGGRQIVATAHYADGSRRDVSHIVAYESSSVSVASVGPRGWVTPRTRGEAVILVRYLEHIELVPLLFIENVAGFVWQPPPENNYVDRLVNVKLRDLRYPPSETCTDAEFVRRVHLDVIGLLPTVEETKAFLADTASDKRAKLVDRLLERDEYARYWSLKWGDLLRMTKKLAGDEGVFKYHRWLEDSFRGNKPHDRFVRELLLGTGSSYGNPPANFYRTTADMNETVETVSQLFLGVRLQCAKCHNHPFDRWSQDNYYGLGAFFDRVKKRGTQVPGEAFIFVASSGETTQPRTGRTMKPWLPQVGDVETAAEADRRESFADWLLAPGNPYFARVEANRIWSQFFARGIVHPVDDFRDSNPASNMPLLDALAREFVESGFDRKRLLRTILRSRTYQASSMATPLNKDDTLYWSHQLPRLLTAEQLLDGIAQVTGIDQTFANLPAGTRATQLPAPDVAQTDFLTTFGQPARGTVCACERTEDSSLGMAIELFNGKLVHGKLVDANNRFRRALAAGRPVEDVVAELYLAAVCREPSADELAAATERCKAAKDPATGVEDVCWALLNSDEFVFQH